MSTISILTLAAIAFLPRTDERTITDSPLAEGEIAHVVNADGTATAWVGGADGVPLPVVDGSALRGYHCIDMARGDLSINTDAGIVYTASNDTWEAANAGIGIHRVVITAASGVKIVEVVYEKREDTIADLSPESIGSISHAVNGNTCVITFDLRSTPSEPDRHLSISRLVIRREGVGSTKSETDLRTHRFYLRDALGAFQFADLRSWVSHLYDGNRGEDWARYKATADGHMDGRRLYFDRRNRYSLKCDETATNITFNASGMPVWSVYASGTGEGYEGCFTFAEFARTESGVRVTYTEDIDGFDISNCVVEAASALDGEWTPLPAANYTRREHGLIEFTEPTHNGIDYAQFYRLSYGGAVSRICRMTVAADIDFRGTVTIGGTNITAFVGAIVDERVGNLNALLEAALGGNANGGAE